MNQLKPKYINVVEAYCDLREAFHFNEDSENKRIGHIVKLAFPSVGKALAPDLSLWNPEKPDCKVDISAAIELLRWEGGSNDPVELRGYFSARNRAQLQEILVLLDESVEIELALVIYEYDLIEEKYFKRFYMTKGSAQLVLQEVQIAEDSSCYQVKKPRVFEFRMILLPKETAQVQEFSFAFSAQGTQFTRQIGG